MRNLIFIMYETFNLFFSPFILFKSSKKLSLQTPPVKRFCTSPDDLLIQKSLKSSENFLKTISEGVSSDCKLFDENSEDLIVQVFLNIVIVKFFFTLRNTL